MISERIKSMLLQAQLTPVRSNVDGITLYCRTYGAEIYIFSLCEFHKKQNADTICLDHIVRQIEEMYFRQGYREVHLLSIIISDNSSAARQYAQSCTGVWVVDVRTNRLIVYENQPADFMGVRKPLEDLLDSELANGSTGKVKQMSTVNTFLIMVNLLVFLMTEVGGDTQNAAYMIECGAMYTPYIVNRGEFYRVFLSMFLHFGYGHLAGNMITLAAVGDNLERALGKGKYFLLYIVSGLGAGMCSFIYNFILGESVVAAGASGAIFGVIGALFYVVLKNKGRLEDISLGRLGILILYVLYSGFTTPGIDNAAHIGGLLIGMLLAVLLYTGKGTVEERKRKQ